MASFITKLNDSQKPLDMFKMRSTGRAFKIALQSLNYYANIIFPLAIRRARFMDQSCQSFESSLNNCVELNQWQN